MSLLSIVICSEARDFPKQLFCHYGHQMFSFCLTFTVCNSCVSESRTYTQCVTFFVPFSAEQSAIRVDLWLNCASVSTILEHFSLFMIPKLYKEMYNS